MLDTGVDLGVPGCERKRCHLMGQRGPWSTGATAEVAATNRPCLLSPRAFNKQPYHSANHVQRPQNPSCSRGMRLSGLIEMRSHYKTTNNRAMV